MCITEELCCIPKTITTSLINYEQTNVKSLSRVRLFATPQTVAYQAPQSMEFSRQEYWSGLPFPSPGIFPTQGLNPVLPHGRQMLYCLSRQGSNQESTILQYKIKSLNSTGIYGVLLL